MPTRIIEQQDGVTARREMLGGLIAVLLHGPCVSAGENERRAGIAFRAHGAEHIGALITLVDGLSGVR